MVSLGIGLTSDCNLNCAHCYRDHSRIYNLTLADIQKVCASLDPESIGFGTGENGLNPEYFDILEYLHGKNIKLTLASNGYTLGITPDEMLKYFGDVEFSVDFPDQSRQDQFRGSGNWQTVMAGIERCHKLGIRISILAVLMDCNYKDLGSIAKLAASFGSNFRVNTYQPMYTTKYLPSFEQYWQAYQRVKGCRHLSFNGAVGPNWVEISVLLKLTRQWREDVVEALEVCFGELFRMEDEYRQAMKAAAEVPDSPASSL